MTDPTLRKLAEDVCSAAWGELRGEAMAKMRQWLKEHPEPAQRCGLCREPTPCACDPLTAPIPEGDMHVDGMRAALVQIRGLALPYVTGDTREAWRAREVCRLVDEATDSRATGTEAPAKGGGDGLLNRDPSPARDAETERADVVAETGKHFGASGKQAP